MNHKYRVVIIRDKDKNISFLADNYPTIKRWIKNITKNTEYKHIKISNRRTKKIRTIEGNIIE